MVAVVQRIRGLPLHSHNRSLAGAVGRVEHGAYVPANVSQRRRGITATPYRGLAIGIVPDLGNPRSADTIGSRATTPIDIAQRPVAGPEGLRRNDIGSRAIDK